MTFKSLLLTDLYQLTMVRAYLSSGKAKSKAVFEVFFRHCPFDGEYAVVAGHNLVKEILEEFYFSEDDLHYLKEQPTFNDAPPEFFEALQNLDFKDIHVRGLAEGSLVFPRVPLLELSGPLYKLQLLESVLLNALNFASLCATYARRLYQVANHKTLVEFGLRRAQGPNGAMIASRSSYIGGCDGTSNVLAGKEFQIPIVGTIAHSFVQSFWAVQEEDLQWKERNIIELLEQVKKEDGLQTNEGELGAFLAYAKTFPSNLLLLVDTYDSLQSGVPNAIRVFKILRQLGFLPIGIRLDSGDLVYLSKTARQQLDQAGFPEAQIFASNELGEKVIESLEDQGAKIDGYGVGTNLVTCRSDPALGGVYKLVELDGHPRMKLSEQTEKLVIPCSKNVYRLYGEDGKMLVDLLTEINEKPPQAGKEIQIFHPYDFFKETKVIPSTVEPLFQTLFSNGEWQQERGLEEIRKRSLQQMKNLREDIRRQHYPTPYKVSLTKNLRQRLTELYQFESPSRLLR